MSYKFKPGNGDELSLPEMTAEELIEQYNFWNRTLADTFFANSATYDYAARMIRELDDEMLKRDVHKQSFNDAGQVQYRLLVA